MFTSKSFLLSLPCLFSLQTFATDLLFVNRDASNIVEGTVPAVTLQELIDSNHKAILNSVDLQQYTQLANWNDYRADCMPVYRYDLCKAAWVSSYTSFIKKGEENQPWYVTVPAESRSKWGEHSEKQKEAYESALEKAKFACLGDVVGKGIIVEDIEDEDGYPCELEIKFECKK